MLKFIFTTWRQLEGEANQLRGAGDTRRDEIPCEIG